MPQGDTYKCTICEATFETIAELYADRVTVHPDANR